MSCLAMQSVTKCTEMWVFLSKSSYCNQLRLVVYPIIYRVLYPRWLFRISEPSTVTCQVVRETRNIPTASSRAEATWCEMWFLRCVGTPSFERQQTHGAPGYLGYQGWRSEIFSKREKPWIYSNSGQMLYPCWLLFNCQKDPCMLSVKLCRTTNKILLNLIWSFAVLFILKACRNQPPRFPKNWSGQDFR